MAKLLALVSAMLFVACSSAEHAPGAAPDYADCGGSFRLEPGFDDERRAGIEAAMRRWNEWARREYFTLSPDGVCPIVLADIEGEGGAAYSDATGRIRVDLARLSQFGRDRGLSFEITMMHELGHSVGMQHIAGPAVMAEDGWGKSDDFTEADRAECERAEFCLR